MAVLHTLGYEHTGMIVNDTTGLASWYGEMFGAQIISRSDDDPPIVFLTFGAGSLVELVPGDPTAAAPNDHVHLSLAVEDMDASLSIVRSAGIDVEKGPFAAYDGSPVVFIRDLEGNLLQLVERRSSLPRPR